METLSKDIFGEEDETMHSDSPNREEEKKPTRQLRSPEEMKKHLEDKEKAGREALLRTPYHAVEANPQTGLSEEDLQTLARCVMAFKTQQTGHPCKFC